MIDSPKSLIFDIKLYMRKLDKQNAIVICTIVLCFMITLGLCYLYSGSSLLQVFAKNNEPTKLYAIASGGYDDITLARQSADMICSRGGAGYVLKDGQNESYEIIFSIYKKKETAESVLGKLGDKSTYIKEMNISAGNMKWCGQDKKEYVNKALGYFDIAFSSLFDVGNEVSKSEITPDDAKVKLEVLATQIDDLKSEFYSRTSQNSAEQITEIKLALVTTLALLDNIEFKSDVAQTSSSIRYQMVQLVLCRQALMNYI